MDDVVAAALNTAAKEYGANGTTLWFVNFITNDVRKGRIASVSPGIYSITSDRWLYFFSSSQVVYLSPVLDAPRSLYSPESESQKHSPTVVKRSGNQYCGGRS